MTVAFSSNMSTSNHFSSLSDNNDIANEENTHLLNSRRPSHTFLDNPIGSFRGVNSLHNFASSFTRAQSFAASKIDNDIHKKRSFFLSSSSRNQANDENEDELFDPELMVPSSRGERLSTVVHDLSNRNQLFASYGGASSGALDSSASPNNDVFYQDDIIHALNGSRSRNNSMYAGHNHAIPIPSRKIYQSPSMSSVRSSISLATTASHFHLKKVEDKDGKLITVLQGQSTTPQTIFNSINLLIGVGLLALPVALLKAGWIIGVPVLVACGLTTYWTASLLSDAMDTDNTIMTYADLGYAAYGSTAKLLISLLFSVDLLGAGVALIVLFSDSLFALLGDDDVWTKTRFKVLSFFILTPFTFLPLPILSIFSLFGIISTISITVLVLVSGLIKTDSPGSLLEVMPTNIWPQSIPDLLLAIGILMAPFGGHAIFPNLKSDMRHPHKFKSSLFPTYTITLLTDSSMAILGFLMFGHYCNNEITNNLLITPGYPAWCYPLLSGLICLIPLAKTPLNAKPIITTLDSMFGVMPDPITYASDNDDYDYDNENDLDDVIHVKHEEVHSKMQYFKNVLKSFVRLINRIGVNAIFVILAIMFPEFDKIIGILGSSICFIICVILPCLFYLKLCGPRIKPFERLVVISAILISTFLSITGTWATLKF